MSVLSSKPRVHWSKTVSNIKDLILLLMSGYQIRVVDCYGYGKHFMFLTTDVVLDRKGPLHSESRWEESSRASISPLVLRTQWKSNEQRNHVIIIAWYAQNMRLKFLYSFNFPVENVTQVNYPSSLISWKKVHRKSDVKWSKRNEK